MRRLFAYIFLWCIGISAMAQEVNTQAKPDSIRAVTPTSPYESSKSSTSPDAPIADFNVDLPDDKPTEPDKKVTVLPSILPRQYMMNWQGGGMSGYNGMVKGFNAYGYHSGAIVGQQWGNLSLTGGLSLSKDMVNAIGIVNGIGGNAALSYRAGRNVSLTAFGGINNYGILSSTPNITTAYYGGYVTLNTNNGKWGMDLGARQVYNSMTGRWETVPIAMPYYNLNGNKLGFDFGGLLYSLFRNADNSINNKEMEMNNRGPAIIPPPIDMKPKMQPTEMPKSMGNSCLQ